MRIVEPLLAPFRQLQQRKNADLSWCRCGWIDESLGGLLFGSLKIGGNCSAMCPVPRRSWTASCTMRRSSPSRGGVTACGTSRRPSLATRSQNQPMRRPGPRPKRRSNRTRKNLRPSQEPLADCSKLDDYLTLFNHHNRAGQTCRLMAGFDAPNDKRNSL